MLIYFTYELPNGEWQTPAAVDTVEEGLAICDGYPARLFFDLKDIPQVLRELRFARNMTQEAAAELLGEGYRKNHISAIENGKLSVGLNLLQRLGEIYGVKIGLSMSTT